MAARMKLFSPVWFPTPHLRCCHVQGLLLLLNIINIRPPPPLQSNTDKNGPCLLEHPARTNQRVNALWPTRAPSISGFSDCDHLWKTGEKRLYSSVEFLDCLIVQKNQVIVLCYSKSAHSTIHLCRSKSCQRARASGLSFSFVPCSA